MSNWPAIDVAKWHQDLPKLRLNLTSGILKTNTENQDFKMYVCGITPYDATHLGHAATYLTFDLINRYLQMCGENVDFVENITDIDDPLFERANRDNQSWSELGESQVALFESDMTSLRVLPPKNYVAVTAAMGSIIKAIELLVSKGFTYELEGNVYFRIKTFLANLPIAQDAALKVFAERGGDPERKGKENPLDPILWISNKDGEPGWQSQMGLGRPGWHIECSVIALENLIGPNYLDETLISSKTISLQGGGSDLIFPHHFMSAALAKAMTNSEFAEAYLHSAMVGLDGEKMSKSKGNLVFVSKLIGEGVDPMVLRHALLSEKYSKDRMWTEAVLKNSQARVALIRSALSKIECAPTDSVIQSIAASIANDLDTPAALEVLDKWAADTVKGEIGGSVGEISRFIDGALGLA
ncbi:MAG: class I tRNA ligase family protein, partial [Actinobacteria bacterium]|nr:class I tRNA ligase family protein [Actinomycetota bacterium]